MPTPTRLSLPRPHLFRTFVVLLVTLGSLAPVRLAARVRDTFVANNLIIEGFLKAKGYDDFNSVPNDVLLDAFDFADETLQNQSASKLRVAYAAAFLLPGLSSSYVSAVSEEQPNNGNIFLIGRGDFSGTLRPNTYMGIGRIEATPAGSALSVASVNLTIDFPAAATNRLFTGFALDSTGPMAYGYYLAPVNGTLSNTPFIVTLPNPAPETRWQPNVTINVPGITRKDLAMLAGDASATLVAGTPSGSVLVGDATRGSGASQTNSPNLWTMAPGGSYTVRNIGNYPGATRTYSFGISGDGSTVLGYYFGAQNLTHAYRWTQPTGFLDLGYLPGQNAAQAYASSPDGSKIVGYCGNAFTWTQAGGMKSLPNLPGMPYSGAFCLSPDGAFIGGASYDAAFNGTATLWSELGKAYNLRLLLLGLGADMTGWVLNQVTAIVKNRDESYNVSGNGVRNGVTQGWMFKLYDSSGRRPTIAAQPLAQAASVGGAAVFSVTATDGTSYQWQRNGVSIAGATSATLNIANALAANAGNYTCIVGNTEGTVTTAPAALTVAPTVSRLTNVSVRSTAGTGANVLIVGFTLGGGGKNVLLRAVGPTLGTFGVPGTLDDPRLALFSASSVQTAQNDDWGGNASLTSAFDAVGAFRLPATSKDAVLLNTLAAGGYTAQVSGAAGTSGVVLLEAYDSDAGSPLARYTNLSARNQVGTGGNILIVGFNITGNGPKNLLIRAVGPSLAQFGVTGTLADPQLAIFNSGGTQTNQNDDWGSSAALTATFDSVGAFRLPAASKDAALSVTLQPGSYTAQVSGAANTTGVALAEIYELP